MNEHIVVRGKVYYFGTFWDGVIKHRKAIYFGEGPDGVPFAMPPREDCQQCIGWGDYVKMFPLPYSGGRACKRVTCDCTYLVG